MKKFKYDEESNCAYIESSSAKVKYSKEILNTFVVDFNSGNNVVGVEIIDAKEVLADFGLDIDKIQSVDLHVKHQPNYIIMTLFFKTQNKEVAIPISPALARAA